MGSTLAKKFNEFLQKALSGFKNKHARICMIGLDCAGKTTILYKLKTNEDVITIPTIGFNVESIKYKNIEFQIFDIGGQDRLRSLWSHYYENTDAIIFVVDSNDNERMNDVKYELSKMLDDDRLRDAKLLMLLNKQDLPNSMNSTKFVEKVGLNKVEHEWFLQPCCALSGEGIYEGLDWLSRKL